MVVTIINQHANNFGDEAACLALLFRLIEKDNVEEINLIYIGAGEIHFNHHKLNHNRDINVKSIGKIQIIVRILASSIGIVFRGNKFLDSYLKIVEKSDLIFVSPAGADLGIYKCWAALSNLYLVNSCGKNVIFHLNTVGSSGNWLFDKMALYILRKSKIYVREKTSQRYLKDNKIKSIFGVDSAFLLPKGNVRKRKDLIIFIPTQLAAWNHQFRKTDIEEKVYLNVVCAVFDFATENNLGVELLPHTGTEDELAYYKEIIKRYGEREDIFIANEINDAMDYQNEICNCAFVVSMRYHGVVISAKNQVPFISVSYENKMNEVCSYVGMLAQNIDVKKVNYKELMWLMIKTYSNLDSIKEELSKSCLLIIDSAERPLVDNVE